MENAKTNKPFSQEKKPVRVLKKQHTVLFTVVSSRDQETGKKQITSDDEDSSDDNTTKSTIIGSNIPKKTNSNSNDKPDCPFGKLCYRTSKTHLAKWKHDDGHQQRILEKKSNQPQNQEFLVNLDHLVIKKVLFTFKIIHMIAPKMTIMLRM